MQRTLTRLLIADALPYDTANVVLAGATVEILHDGRDYVQFVVIAPAPGTYDMEDGRVLAVDWMVFWAAVEDVPEQAPEKDPATVTVTLTCTVTGCHEQRISTLSPLNGRIILHTLADCPACGLTRHTAIRI